MTSYKELYFDLFRKLARGTELLEQGQVIRAIDLLIRAQREAEERCLEADIIPENRIEGPKEP